MANTPEDSDHTSVQKRLTYAKDGKQTKKLLRFAGMPRQIMREDKRGYIDNMNLPLLERLNISPENWVKLTTQFTRVFHGAVGRQSSQASYCENLNRKRRADLSNCEKLLA